MTILWRTDGPWGSSLGRDLNPDEIDGNFYDLDLRVQSLESITLGRSIDYIDAVGNILTIHYTDHSTDVITIPRTLWNFRGDWLPDTDYVVMDVITANGSTYMVTFDHHSALTFDPGATSGPGQDHYGLMLSVPSNVLPAGGAIGQGLRKASDTDFDIEFYDQTIEELTDVALLSPLSEAHVLTWDDSINRWVNRVVSVPAPTSGARGGVEPLDVVASQFVVALGTDGLLVTDTVDFSDLTGVVSHTQLLQVTKQIASQSAGNITLNRASGEIIATSISANITAITMSGWPASGYLGRIVWDLTNTGAFTVAGYPAAVIWAGGTVPTISSGSGKKDRLIFSSWDGGTTIFGDVVGQNYV